MVTMMTGTVTPEIYYSDRIKTEHNQHWQLRKAHKDSNQMSFDMLQKKYKSLLLSCSWFSETLLSHTNTSYLR